MMQHSKFSFLLLHLLLVHLPLSALSFSVQAQGWVTPETFILDPLLTSALQEASSSSLNVGGLSTASKGVRVWRETLVKGRLPVEGDFVDITIWPVEPLFSNLSQKMALLNLPRFVFNHPETINAVLLSLIRITIEYTREISLLGNEHQEDNLTSDEISSHNIRNDEEGQENQFIENILIDESNSIIADAEEVAQEICEMLVKEFSGVVSGVGILDQLFGLDHELLVVDKVTPGGSPSGFGIQDGIWQHSGWKEIPALQKQIAGMPELKNLLKKLGRRPTAENSDKIQKFAPRKLRRDGALGAQFDPKERDSVSGVTLSGSFSEMLPSEAVLLRGASPALRKLFMVKKLESKLLSYEMSGWTDVPSVSIANPRYFKKLPSAPGGPIIICLDTSWSMGGMREHLSKAVVIACVSEARKQARDCQVVAFSTERGTMEAGEITADNFGIQRLLGFLSHSFGGGTDVTGALKFAMTSIEKDVMSAADILLISDGEIPDPPISSQLMEELSILKLRKDVQVHGLLVGKSESLPMSKICCETHDFLTKYDILPSSGAVNRRPQTVMGSCFSPTNSPHVISATRRMRKFFNSHRHPELKRMGSVLRAKMSRYDEDGRRTSKKKKNNKWKNEYDNYDDEGYDSYDDDNSSFQSRKKQEDQDNSNSNWIVTEAFTNQVQEATNLIKKAAEEKVAMGSWRAEELEQEKNTNASLSHETELKAAVARVEEGLVERGEESRLVVLSMIANEHILLLGVPGTGKSVLGRRLAKLCSGSFFQRLLTRFSTPDELFGPLSLKSLENDEYRRCTAGFLPTASVAFLDEIFKANSAILNTLLTILNERKFDNAGGQEDCPIRCVLGASNELPESDDLIALFDRFLIRKQVLPLSDEGAYKLLSMANPGISPCDSDDNTTEACDVIFSEGLQKLVEALATAADNVQISDHICKLMVDLRTFMKEDQNVEISDRRLAKTARLLKLSAATHGRNRVDAIDCLLLQHCMWQLPEQRKAVRDWLWDNMTPGAGSADQFRFLLENLRREIITVIRKTNGDITGEYGARDADVMLIQSLQNEAGNLVKILRRQKADLARHTQLLEQAEEYLWMDPQEALSMKQLLIPRAKLFTEGLSQVLTDASALEMALIPETSSPELRLSIIEELWEEGLLPEVRFSDVELNMAMKEAKAKYDLETFRKWKRAKKAAQ